MKLEKLKEKIIEKGLDYNSLTEPLGLDYSTIVKEMKIISIDAETLSLRNEPFAVSFVIEENNKIKTQTFRRTVAENEACDFVKENVIPNMTCPITHTDRKLFLFDIAQFWLENKENAITIAHCAAPVETELFQLLYKEGLIGEFDGPFPLHEVASMLLIKNENPFSVDEYVKKHNLKIDHIGTTHDPEYDAVVALEVFKHLIS